MSHRFQSKAAGPRAGAGPAGDSVLKAMGVVPAATRIIQPEAMPAVISAVEAAIAQDESLRPADRSADVQERAGEMEAVSLRQRARPLVEMMRRAHAAGQVIVWGT